MSIRKFDLGNDLDGTHALNSGASGASASLNGSTMLKGAGGMNGSPVSLDLAGGRISVGGTDGPVKVGGPGGGAVTQDFGDVHLDTDGSHWVLTDGVDSIVLTGASSVTIDGQVYRLVDHFGSGEGGHQTIQAAVDAAGDGDIVLIAGGTYTEQVVVDGHSNLTIQALSGDDVDVVAPADVVQTATSSSGRALNGVITVLDSTNVEIVGLDVDGAGHADTVDGASANFVGIVYRNASGGTTDVDITGIRDPYPGGTTTGGNPLVSGNQRGVGIQVDNDALMAFFMDGGSISDFQKNAGVFNFADLDVSGVTVTGGGAQTINAQNGLQAGNCSGAIYDCMITALGYAGTSGNPAADPYSGGILLLGNNTDLSIHDNTIVGANGEDADAKVVGIFVLDIFYGANNGGGVTDNDISFCDSGIGVYGDIGASGYDVSGNSVTDIDPNDYYVLINPQFGGVDFEPTDTLNVAFNISGSGAADYLAGAAEGDTLTGQDGDDGLHGNGGADELFGGSGVDDLDGGDGNDSLDGGTGADAMAGGDGDDTYYVDDAGDTATENASEGTDLVYSSVSHALGANVEDLTLTGSDDIDGTGNDLANVITGNSGNNALDGGTGVDTLIGGVGDDDYTVDETADVVTENASEGHDTVYASANYTLSADVEDLILTDSASLTHAFDDMALGPIADGEGGWKYAGTSDQEIVDLGGGNYAFRMSSDPTTGAFGGPYSPDVGVSAGESTTTADVTSQSIKFDFKAVDSSPDGSRLEVDFGTVGGTDRNNFMVIESDASVGGIRIAVNEPLLDGNWTNNDFTAFTGNRTLVDGVDASAWHTIELRLSYVDGADNDVIQVYLDGSLIGVTTTFENYRDALGGTHPDNAEANQTSRLFFRNSAGGGAPQDGPGGDNEGFYFDNITNTAYNNLSGTGNELANTITGNSGDNHLSGMDGNDSIDGGVGDDTIYGGADEDQANGGAGNDTVAGDGENDMLFGDDGDDILDGGDGDDELQGGAGSDAAGYLSAASGVKVKLEVVGAQDTLGAGNDTLVLIDNVIGSNFDDQLFGDGDANMLAGMGGKDRFQGKEGDDALFGGADNDRLTGGDGADMLIGGTGNDKMKGQLDADTFAFADGFGNDTIKGFDVAEDTLLFDSGIAGDIHTVIVNDVGTLVYTDAGDSVLLKHVFDDVTANIVIGTAPTEPGDYLI
jgi:hypothetical protein